MPRRPPVLVTGASGFIGSHVVRELMRVGCPVRALVRASSDVRHLRALGTEIFVADLLRAESLAAPVQGVSGVVHLAGVMQAPDEEAHRIVHVDGTMNLLDAVARYAKKIRRFVFVSSLAAVGPNAGREPLDETITPSPVNAYGRTKLEAEAEIQERRDRFPVTIFRPPLVYGPRDRSLLPYFQAIRAGVMLLPDNGEQPLSVVHAADLASAVRLALERDHPSGSVFHVADGPSRRLRDLAEAVRLASATPAVAISVPRELLSTARSIGRFALGRRAVLPAWLHPDTLDLLLAPGWTCTGALLRETLGWEPATTLLEGLRATVQWYREADWLLPPWAWALNRLSLRPSKAPPDTGQT